MSDVDDVDRALAAWAQQLPGPAEGASGRWTRNARHRGRARIRLRIWRRTLLFAAGLVILSYALAERSLEGFVEASSHEMGGLP